MENKDEKKKSNRKFRIDNVIRDTTVGRLINDIQAAIEQDSESPIYLTVNTYGGSVYDGFALYDFLRSLPVTLVVICEGKVMSMGTIIILAGDIIVSRPNTTFMVHEVSTLVGGKLADIENDVKETKRLDKMAKNVYKHNLVIDVDQIDELMTGADAFFDAKKAKALGFVHEIINSDEEIWS